MHAFSNLKGGNFQAEHYLLPEERKVFGNSKKLLMLSMTQLII